MTHDDEAGHYTRLQHDADEYALKQRRRDNARRGDRPMTDDDKLLAEIEARHDELERRTFRYEDFRWAHADRAALLAIVRRQQAEITSLTGQCASMAESFAGAVTVNDNLREREAALRAAAEWRPIETCPFDGRMVMFRSLGPFGTLQSYGLANPHERERYMRQYDQWGEFPKEPLPEPPR